MSLLKEKQLSCLEETTSKKTCAFTGHRTLEKDCSYVALKRLIKTLIQDGIDTFLCGMAIGFDLLAARAVLSLKRKYPFIKLVACVPCYGQEKYFSERDKKEYADTLKKADESIVLAPAYYNGCMQKRDIYMADRADVMIAYCKKTTGGAAFTVRYFQRKYPEKEIYFL